MLWLVSINFILKLFEKFNFFFAEFLKDGVSVQEIRQLWLKLLEQNLALVCLVDNAQDFKNPKVAGVNITYSTKYEDFAKKTFTPNGKASRICLEISEYYHRLADYASVLPEEYCMGALGLVVLPEYRGMGVATEIVKAREPLAKAVGLKSIVTVFTSPASRKVGEKNGYTTLVKIPFGDLTARFPPYVFDLGENDHEAITYKILK